MQSTIKYHDLTDTRSLELQATLNGLFVPMEVNASFAIRDAWSDSQTGSCDYDLTVHDVIVSDAYGEPLTKEIIELAHKEVETWLHSHAWELLQRN